MDGRRRHRIMPLLGLIIGVKLIGHRLAGL
jgi:hypothetical protein